MSGNDETFEHPSDDADFAALLSAALDPGEIELGAARHAELRAALGLVQAPHDPELEAFGDFLSLRLDPGEIELDAAARRRITGAAETLRPGELVSWALGELPPARREEVEGILAVRPDLRDEALAFRHFCQRLCDRLPGLSRPGMLERWRLRNLFRETGSTAWRTAALGLAAVLALAFVPFAWNHSASLEVRKQAAATTRRNAAGNAVNITLLPDGRKPAPTKDLVANSPVAAPAQVEESETGEEESPAIAMREQVPPLLRPVRPTGSGLPLSFPEHRNPLPLYVAEVPYVPVISGLTGNGDSANTAVALVKTKSPDLAMAPRLAQVSESFSERHALAADASSGGGGFAMNSGGGGGGFAMNSVSVSVSASAAPVLMASAEPAMVSMGSAREFGSMAVGFFAKNLGFDPVSSTFTVTPGSDGVPGVDPGGGDEEAAGGVRLERSNALFNDGTAILANLQPYLLTALVSSTGNGHGPVAMEDGLVWDASAGYHTLDFDSFAAGAGMRADTWSGTVSVAKAIAPDLTLGADLSALDSRGKIDRYGRMDVSGSVIGWSLDWQHGPWELGMRHAVAALDQDLTRTSGGAGRASEDALLQQIDLHAGWKMDAGPFRHGPVVNLQAGWGHLDAYLEPGATGSSLGARDFDSLDTLAGWEAAGHFENDLGQWRPQFLAGWRHRLSVPDSAVRQGGSGGLSVFQPDVPERDSLMIQAGLRWEQKGGPMYAEGAAGLDWRGGESDRSLLLRIGARF